MCPHKVVPKASILLAEDEEAQRRILADFLTSQGYEVKEAANGKQALSLFRRRHFAAVIADLKMPEMDGLHLLAELRRLDPEVPIVLTTAFATVESAVAAMKQGANDYLTKPINLEELLIILQRTTETYRLARENRALKEMLQEGHQFDGFVSVSAAMASVLDLVQRAADSEAPVLVRGESGTGKELIARMLHLRSPRTQGPYLSLNCAAIPETLLESELFGHEKGAFTGATKGKPGRLELADGGTLFLDEIGDMSLPLQAKMLRALEQKAFERVGGLRTITVDVRVVAATNRNLEEMMQAGEFRSDLYYRLNVIEINIPPLRQRREDIPALVDHFLARQARKRGTAPKKLSPEARAALLHYHWPGNVRELENVIERACILSRGEIIEISELPPLITSGASGSPAAEIGAGEPLPARLASIERQAIAEALRRTGGVQTKAAEILGISERVLRYKMNKHGLR